MTTNAPLTKINSPTSTLASNHSRIKVRALKLVLALLAGLLALTLWAEPASACRDCPFPIRLEDGIYEMPGGNAQIWMETRRLTNGRAETWVALIDSRTGYTLAEGWVRHAYSDRRLSLKLDDFMGGGVRLEIFWQDVWKQQIRVRMACIAPRCNVQQKYMR
jgi:hypothetical protein